MEEKGMLVHLTHLYFLGPFKIRGKIREPEKWLEYRKARYALGLLHGPCEVWNSGLLTERKIYERGECVLSQGFTAEGEILYEKNHKTGEGFARSYYKGNLVLVKEVKRVGENIETKKWYPDGVMKIFKVKNETKKIVESRSAFWEDGTLDHDDSY